jgi:hypothetical protein
MLANSLCRGSNNTLNQLFPNPPDQSEVFKWDASISDFGDSAVYTIGSGWSPDLKMQLGEGFGFFNSGPTFTQTFVGCEPTCPPPCSPTNGCALAGALGSGAATWTNVFSCPPPCGTTLGIWNYPIQDFDYYTYLNNTWTPPLPLWPPGVAVKVCVATNYINFACPNDITNTATTLAGAMVNYTCPNATSDCCPPVTVTCAPPPGLFPIGVTAVTCTAVDSCQHTNICKFNVAVTAPCPPNIPLNAVLAGPNIVLSWSTPWYHLQMASTLGNPSGNTVWVDVPGSSPVTLPAKGQKFFRLVCP